MSILAEMFCNIDVGWESKSGSEVCDGFGLVDCPFFRGNSVVVYFVAHAAVV